MKKVTVIILLLFIVTISVKAQSIKKYTESASHFNKPIEFSNKEYPESDMYRAYKKANTGFRSIGAIQNDVEEKIRSFAKKHGKSFVILGQMSSNPPFIVGNYPRVEIIFVLVDK